MGNDIQVILVHYVYCHEKYSNFITMIRLKNNIVVIKYDFIFYCK